MNIFDYDDNDPKTEILFENVPGQTPFHIITDMIYQNPQASSIHVPMEVHKDLWMSGFIPYDQHTQRNRFFGPFGFIYVDLAE